MQDAESIDGAWLPLAAELGGEKFPDEVRKTIKLVVGDGKYTVTVGAAPDKGAVKLDPSTNPKSLDVIGAEGPNKGKTFLAIYEKTGDTLRICYDLSGKTRPTEFKTAKGSQLFSRHLPSRASLTFAGAWRSSRRMHCGRVRLGKPPS